MHEIRPDYRCIETRERVPNFTAECRTRFFWRAERRCRRLNAERWPSTKILGYFTYRWEVVKDGNRYYVAAFQNQAIHKNELEAQAEILYRTEAGAEAMFLLGKEEVARTGIKPWHALDEWQRESWRKEILEPVA